MADDATPDSPTDGAPTDGPGVGGTGAPTAAPTGRRSRGGTGRRGTDPPTLDELMASVTALAKTVERVAVEQGKQNTGVTLLAGEVRKLARAVADAAKASDDGLRPHVSWLLPIDPAIAVTGLADLHGWVNAVYLQWPGSELPSCWQSHPWVIEELWTLWECHIAAWHPDSGTVEKVSDFMERRRPGAQKRVATVIGCRLTEHSEGSKLDHQPLMAPLPGGARRVALSWATFGYRHQQPYPLDQELREAKEYDQRRLN